MKTVRFLFNDGMARAIVQGRKTVTRRPVMPHDIFDDFKTLPPLGIKAPCAPGDILIGRECWADVNSGDGPAFLYRAGGFRFCSEDAFPVEYERYPSCTFSMWHTDLLRGEQGHRWRPSIHMPDWAARIRRRVVSVTVERLQDITEDDAVREGFATSEELEEFFRNCAPPGSRMARPLYTFEVAWNGIYAAKGLGWDSNCWVWRIEFERENVQEVSNGR